MKLRRTIASGIAATALAVLTTSMATITSTSAAPVAQGSAQPTQGEDHSMGSQIRKHEGVSRTPTRSQRSEAAIAATVEGIDVSGHQGNVDWKNWWDQGKRFVWVKATESTSYRNPYFSQQYGGSYTQGFIRGAYHFALPNESTGAAQAKYFSDNGGGWSGDGKTLPGALDMEYNPYGADCYGLTRAQMKTWITDFITYYKNRWSKYPIIYTSASWWNSCVNADFHQTIPLWVARYSTSVGTLPYNWSTWTVWQYSDANNMDKNVFNGSLDRLKVFAGTAD